MPTPRASSRPVPDIDGEDIRAGATFIEFVEAFRRGQLARAGRAQDELFRLGFAVAPRHRRTRRVKSPAAS